MPIVLVGLALAVLVMLLFGDTQVDRSLVVLLRAGDASPLIGPASFLVDLSNPVVLFAASGVGAGILLIRSTWPRALLLLGMVVSGMLIGDYLGHVTAGARPALDAQVGPPAPTPFPHPGAASATIVWIGLAYLLAKASMARGVLLAGAAALAVAAGLAPLLLGAAWPSDVIGGWAFGLFWTLLLLRLAGEDLGDRSDLREASGRR